MEVATDSELAEVERMSKSYADEEALEAEAMPMPDPASVGVGVYAGGDQFRPDVEIVGSPFATKR